MTNVVPMTCLRAALDWCNLLVDVDIERWPLLAMREHLALSLPAGTGHVGSLSISLERDGAPDPGAKTAVWRGGGVRLSCCSPEFADREAGRYPAKIEVQGAACSLSTDGIGSVEAIRRAVASLLWPSIPAATVDSKTQPGRFDICTDIAIHADPETGSDLLERGIFARGNCDRATAPFSTHAGAATRGLIRSVVSRVRKADLGEVALFGSHKGGRTLTIGRDPRLSLYEKDRNTGRNGRDLPDVRARWTEAGWNGTDRVFRIEFRCTRDWLADNDLHMGDGSVTRLGGTNGVTWSAFAAWLPDIMRTLLSRTRRTDPHGRNRKSRREDSRPWVAAREGCARWEQAIAERAGATDIDTFRGLGVVLARRRRETLERAFTRVERGLIVGHAAMRADGQQMSLPGLAAGIADALLRDEGYTSLERARRLRGRTARALNIQEPEDSEWSRSRFDREWTESVADRGAREAREAKRWKELEADGFDVE